MAPTGGEGLKREKGVYGKLFLSTLKLSAGTFGGGFVIVPLMREKFVNELHWIDEQEMLDLVAIAESSPGAIAVNASILVGYHVAGCLGALLAVLGTVLPPLVIISVLSGFYGAVRDNAVVNMAMTGMLAGVAAVICDTVLTMGAGVLRQKRLLYPAVMVLSFIAVRFLNVNIVAVILTCAVVGAADTVLRKHGGQFHRKAVRRP